MHAPLSTTFTVPIRKPMHAPIRTRKRRTRGSWKGIFLVLAIGAGLLVYQRRHIQHHLPLIQAGIAAAEIAGPTQFEEIGVPPDSIATEIGEQRTHTGGRRSMWQGTPTSIEWSRTYEMPGTFPAIVDWYHSHLHETGWRPVDISPAPRLVQNFRKGAWTLTLSRKGDFTSPPRTRVIVELEWSYWQSTQ